MEDRLKQQGVLKVTKIRVLAVLVAILLAMGLLGVTAAAQPRDSGAAPSGSRFRAEIYLVDVGVLLKKHPRFEQYMNDLQTDMQRADAAMKQEQATIKKMQEGLNEFKPGTQQYEDLEKRVVGKLADFNARVTLQRKEFLKAEAKIYHMLYQQIQEEVEAFAKDNGVLVVLKFNSEITDVEQPDTIARGLNNPVVWYHKNLDITGYILENLKRRSGGERATNPNYRFPK